MRGDSLNYSLAVIHHLEWGYGKKLAKTESRPTAGPWGGTT